MKNASLIFLCCILCIVITPIAIHLCDDKKRDNVTESNIIISVLQTTTNSIVKMPLEEYVWRATAKEMPNTFSDDALKAQAVAVRTYAARKIGVQIPEHKGADVCTDFNHCTAFMIPGEETNSFGEEKDEICERISLLVSQTKNQILTYEGEPILAVFHAISSGITEKSSDVWVKQLPYLTNVESNLDKAVNGYHSSVDYSVPELKDIFASGDNSDDIKILSRTAGGSVKEIKIFGENYDGKDVRQKLNLRSANFTITQNSDNVIFDVIGYGHGVGMSQSGANEYAKIGMSYLEILDKYYPGTTISNIKEILSPR